MVPEQSHVLLGASLDAGERALEQLVGGLIEEIILENAVVLLKTSFLDVVLSASKVHVTVNAQRILNIHASVGVVGVDLMLIGQLV